MGESAVRAKSVSGRVSDMIGRGLWGRCERGEENPAFYHWRGAIPAEPVQPPPPWAIGTHAGARAARKPSAGRRPGRLAGLPAAPPGRPARR
ncbi:hypothetical protein BDI4_1410008 [Burkholderia diffusa]|nr:hypothetical protein BDI4_1410008 [Burkholderia diffusa]